MAKAPAGPDDPGHEEGRPHQRQRPRAVGARPAGLAPRPASLWCRGEGIADELGDLVIATVNVARHAHVDAELAARAAAAKFRRRFEAVEVLAAERGVELRSADLATLDALWDEVKAGH